MLRAIADEETETHPIPNRRTGSAGRVLVLFAEDFRW